MSSAWLPLPSQKGQGHSTNLQSSDKFLLGMLGDIYRAFVLNLMRKETKGVISHGK